MAPYYLRMEGVNICNFIDDTADLSTIRGGSFLLGFATRDLGPLGLTAVSTGASAGIFSFQADDDDAARSVSQNLRDHLRKTPGLVQATFVVDFIAKSEQHDFLWHREALLARNRCRQMRSPSFAVPTPLGICEPCELDGVRPAVEKDSIKGVVSPSVKRRLDYGRLMKDRVFMSLAGKPYSCVSDFSEISDGPPAEFDSLANKLTVVHLDGNNFGTIQDDLCKSEKDQAAFDDALQKKAKGFLRGLIELAERSPEKWFRGKELRLEVLLLAGDEIRIVVPAWCGWAALQFFFEQVMGWKFTNSEGVTRELTYKAGLVFCQSHSPIHRVKKLASDLAEFAKRHAPDGNVLAYQVLESFDHLGQDLESFKVRRRLPGTAIQNHVLRGEQMRQIADWLGDLEAFPRNKLHEIAMLYSNNLEKEGDAVRDRARKDLDEPTLTALDACLSDLGMAGWMHWMELSDYAIA